MSTSPSDWIDWISNAGGGIFGIALFILIALWLVAALLLPLVVLSLHAHAAGIRRHLKRQNQLLLEISHRLRDQGHHNDLARDLHDAAA